MTLANTSYGQISKGQFVIKSYVYDNVTRNPLQGSKVYLLNENEEVLDSATTSGGLFSNGKLVEVYSRFTFNISKPGIYKVRASYKGYDDNTATYDLTKIRKREQERELPAILLQRTINKQLEGVTVTTTKLKFYNRGDTLIYNADAFNLAEGSMLDALIRQLPGAELKSDGRIYVNGKFVESLMLNGKDFFKGNNQIMLDNLPTYMVQNVKVYDKLGNRSNFLGYDTGDKEYVMDVILKKQYRIGWV